MCTGVSGRLLKADNRTEQLIHANLTRYPSRPPSPLLRSSLPSIPTDPQHPWEEIQRLSGAKRCARKCVCECRSLSHPQKTQKKKQTSTDNSVNTHTRSKTHTSPDATGHERAGNRAAITQITTHTHTQAAVLGGLWGFAEFGLADLCSSLLVSYLLRTLSSIIKTYILDEWGEKRTDLLSINSVTCCKRWVMGDSAWWKQKYCWFVRMHARHWLVMYGRAAGGAFKTAIKISISSHLCISTGHIWDTSIRVSGYRSFRNPTLHTHTHTQRGRNSHTHYTASILFPWNLYSLKWKRIQHQSTHTHTPFQAINSWMSVIQKHTRFH